MRLEFSEDVKRVDYATAKRRALKFLRTRPKHDGQRVPIPANYVADHIWPGNQMRPQGAGGAASRILKRMQEEKLAFWVSRREGWGWVCD